MPQSSGLAQAQQLIEQYRTATLALRAQAGVEEVHGYRIAARRLLALLALWRPLIPQPCLERRLMRAVGRLSALRDAQVFEERFGGKAITMPPVRVPMLRKRLARWLARLAQVPAEFNPLPLFQLQLALSLGEGVSEPGLDRLPAGDPRQLRHWHRLRLLLKQIRYGVELLVAQGEGDPAWLSRLILWQDRLGQLQDSRQWLKRLGRKGVCDKRRRQQRRLEEALQCQLQQLHCQQAELIGLRLLMQHQA